VREAGGTVVVVVMVSVVLAGLRFQGLGGSADRRTADEDRRTNLAVAAMRRRLRARPGRATHGGNPGRDVQDPVPVQWALTPELALGVGLPRR